MPERQSPRALAVQRNRLSSWADKWLFVVLFLLGTAAIIGLKRRGASQWLVTAVPVAVMAVYAAFIGLTPRYRLRLDRAGDSLYYLGFLFTMVSLANSLYEFGQAGAGTETIVTNFGVALATTILGLMFRVLFHQLREDPFDVEREVYLDLSEMASRLRDEVLQSVQDFNALRVAIAQSVEEATAGAATKLVEVLRQSLDRYKTSADSLATTVQEAAGQLKSHQSAMTEAARKAAASVERLAERLDQVDIPAAVIRSKLEGIANGLDTFVEGLSRRADIEKEQGEKITEQLKTGLVAAEALRGELETLTVVTKAHQAWIRKGTEDLDKAIHDLNSLASGAVQQSKTVSDAQQTVVAQLIESTSSALRTAHEHRTRLESDVADSSALLSQVHRSLVSLTRVLAQELDGKPRRL